MADVNLGQIIHTDLNEPLDVTNKALHVHTSTGENVDLASVLSKLTELDNKIDAISNADNLNVQQVGKTMEVTKILDAISLASETSTGDVDLGLTGEEKLVTLVIQIDQQPWILKAGNNFAQTAGGGGNKIANVYPRYDSETNTFVTPFYATSYLWGVPTYGSSAYAPTNINEFKEIYSPPVSGIQAGIYNGSASVATVNLWVMKELR